jgi:thermostable 8-oxoguanine DNA glycosylase
MNLIDPKHVTNFERTDSELQIFWIYCTMVAGKNADQTASKLSKFLSRRPAEQTPFEYLRENLNDLHSMLVAHRVGQYYRLEKCIRESLDLDLRVCDIHHLESVFGVGPKTARFFVLHTRRDAKCAVIDVHILRWLRQHQGGDKALEARIPKATPQNRDLYRYFERMFIDLAQVYYPGIPLADVDLLIWIEQSGRLDNDAYEPELPHA